MSFFDYKRNRLNKEEARKLIGKLASTGKVILSQHARKRLTDRDIILNDVINVLLSKSMRISEAEFENNTYRYRCQTNRFIVVIGFSVTGENTIIITVWKTERKIK